MLVKIGNKEYTLTKPTSFAEAWDVVALGEEHAHRAFAAALGICCPDLARKLKLRYAGDAKDFGGKMIDALVARGLTMQQITTAGVSAAGLCFAMMVPASEVAAAEAFTEAEEEDSTL